MREDSVFMYDVPQKFGRKQGIKRDRIQILLKHVPSKGKIYLDSIYNATTKLHKDIVIKHKSLSDLVEELVNLN